MRPICHEMYYGFPWITGILLLGASLDVIRRMFGKKILWENAWLFGLWGGCVLCMVLIAKGNGGFATKYSMMICLLAGCIYTALGAALFGWLWKCGKMNRQRRGLFILLFSCGLCATLLTVGGLMYSNWCAVWRLFPGASAIRSETRLMVILMFPAGILLAVFLNRIQEKLHGRKLGAVFMTVVALLLYLDHLNIGGMEHFSISENRAFLESVSEPPPDCRVFFVIGEEEQTILSRV